MRQATQRAPLRLVKEGPAGIRRRPPTRGRYRARDLWTGRIVSTWLYDQVDRHAREVYEMLLMRARETRSRCA